jgi:hypothetical protein
MIEKNKTKKIFLVIKIILWCLPLILFVWVLDKNFVPRGQLEVKYDVTEESKLVRNFASKEKDKLIGTKNQLGNEDYFQLITTSPVYFDVKVPRPFAKAIVSLKYQNPDSQPAIKLGVKQANEAYYYQDLAFMHPVLESLPDHWDKAEDGDLVLWQKNKAYKEEKEKKQQEFEEKEENLDNWLEEELEKIDAEYGVDHKGLSREEKEELELKKQIIQEKYQEDFEIITEENKVEEKSDPEFVSPQEFLNNFPDPTAVLQYNYALSSHLEMPGYQKSHKTIEINKSMRGSHEIYTYIGQGEDLNFIFTIQDINRHAGADFLKITVYDSKGEKVNEVSAPDDGEAKATGRVFPERRHQLLMENIPFGIYRLVINIPDDDIFIKKIETFQHLVMFKKNIYLTDNEEYKIILGDKSFTPTTIYTNGSVVKARTAHENGLQTLRVGYRNLNIDEKHVLKEIETTNEITSIVSPKNDIYIQSNGFFAFSKDQLFDPNFSLVMDLDKIKDVEEYDYIFADYPQAQLVDGWLVAETSVEVPYLYFNENKDKVVNFIFSLPGLPENNRVLKIKEMTIHFEKEPFTLDNFFPRIKNWLKNIFMEQ